MPKLSNSTFVRDAASWKLSGPGKTFVRDGGSWKDVRSLYVRDGGSWKAIWKFFVGILRPNGDIETSDWTSTPLFEKLDEVSPDDATTEITSSRFFLGGNTFDFEIRLVSPFPPSTPTGQETVTLRVRHWLEIITGTTIINDVTIELKEGAVVKKSISITASEIAYSTSTITLSQAEKDSITDWDDLRVRVEYHVQMSGGIETSEAHVTWIELQFS